MSNKTVKIKMTVVFDAELPDGWTDQEFVERHQDGGGWCRASLIEELNDYAHNCLSGFYDCIDKNIHVELAKEG